MNLWSFTPLVPNNTYAGSEGTKFISPMQHMHQPIMAIFVLP